MGQNWNVFTDKLTGNVGVIPVKVSRRRIAAKKLPNDRKRLVAEVAHRIDEISAQPCQEESLSRVEKVMRRNAPDLAGAPEQEILAAQTRRYAYKKAHWPRPRLAALIFAGTLGAFHPLDVMRLGIWCVVIFLVASVAVGPERARDGAEILWQRILHFWKVELFLVIKLANALMSRIGGWFRTAL